MVVGNLWMQGPTVCIAQRHFKRLEHLWILVYTGVLEPVPFENIVKFIQLSYHGLNFLWDYKTHAKLNGIIFHLLFTGSVFLMSFYLVP